MGESTVQGVTVEEKQGKCALEGDNIWHFALQDEKAGKHVKVKNLLKMLRLQSMQKCALETYY